jgi:2-(1,2-epoxy-1,2-dihydrophenyl)acetyl-CoA isomerase
MSAPDVLAEVKDGIGRLTLNRPESLNALSFEMTDLAFLETRKAAFKGR